MLDAGELSRVTIHDLMQCRQGRQALLFDQRMNTRQETGIAQNLEVGLKNLGRRRSQFLRNPLNQAFELGFGLFHRAIKVGNLGRNLARVFQRLGFART